MGDACEHDFGPAAYDKGETHEAVAVVCVKCGYLAVRTEAADPPISERGGE